MQLSNKNFLAHFIGLLGLTVAIIIFSKFPIIFNVTNSLPQRIFIIHKGDYKFKVGDFVAAYSRGLPNLSDGIKLIKMVRGLPLDKIEVINRKVYINAKECCTINDKTGWWGAIHPVELKVIPKDCYFVVGTSYHSFDSRYKEFGLICKSQILGKAYSLL